MSMIKNLLIGLRARYQSVKSSREFSQRLSGISKPTIKNPKNVVIITIDCLRNDHLSRSGYDRETTPYLDSLTEGTAAITAAPWTFSSVPSILTGFYPHNHGAVYPKDEERNQDFSNPPHGIDKDVPTLGELLGAAGYETRFATAVGTAAIPMLGRFANVVNDHNAKASEIFDATSDWWDETDEPKFAYIQLGDLHEPLHKPDRTPFGEIPSIEGVERWRFGGSIRPHDEFKAYRKARILLYDTLLREIDREIERFISSLNNQEETIIIITSDHGEEFWEYRDFETKWFDDPRGIAGIGHGHALVPPVIEVPIISDSLDIADTDGYVSTVDIVPSIMAALDAEGVPDNDGHQLSDSNDRPVISQEIAYGPNQISVTEGSDHLITIPVRDEALLLDFTSGKVVKDIDRMSDLSEHIPSSRTIGDTLSISDDTKDRLADLGYR